MDYFRWLAFVKFIDFFDNGIFLPIVALNILFVGVVTAVFWTLGLILSILSIVFWSFVVFLFLERAWKKNREEYRKFLNNQ